MPKKSSHILLNIRHLEASPLASPKKLDDSATMTPSSVRVGIMARSDALSEIRDRLQGNMDINPNPAAYIRSEALRRRIKGAHGSEISPVYPFLFHYTTKERALRALEEGVRGGAWVCPTPYSACMAPYRLGLYSPKDYVVILNTHLIPEVFGPATAPPGLYPRIWQGQGIEFMLGDEGASNECVIQILNLLPCGDATIGATNE